MIALDIQNPRDGQQFFIIFFTVLFAVINFDATSALGTIIVIPIIVTMPVTVTPPVAPSAPPTVTTVFIISIR